MNNLRLPLLENPKLMEHGHGMKLRIQPMPPLLLWPGSHNLQNFLKLPPTPILGCFFYVVQDRHTWLTNTFHELGNRRQSCIYIYSTQNPSPTAQQMSTVWQFQPMRSQVVSGPSNVEALYRRTRSDLSRWDLSSSHGRWRTYYPCWP